MDIAYRDVTNPSHVSSTIQASDGSTINPTCVHAPSSTDSAVTLGNFRINLSGSIKSLIARYCSEEHTNTGKAYLWWKKGITYKLGTKSGDSGAAN